MFKIADFLWAITSDSRAIFAILVSVSAMLLNLTHIVATIPSWGLWAIAYLALFVAAWRVWYKEYRHDAPSVELEYVQSSLKDDEIVLCNQGSETAFNVKVEDVLRGDNGYISFEPIKVKAKDRVVVKGIVHRSPATSLIFRSRLTDFLLATQPPTRADLFLKGVEVPFYVDFMTIHGHMYKSQFNVTLFPMQDKVEVAFKGCRRRFEPITPLRWLSELPRKISNYIKHLT